jgi:hypothetical protein
VTDKYRQGLLDASAEYLKASDAFTTAIIAAKARGRMSDEEIADLTGYPVPMVGFLLGDWHAFDKHPPAS